MGKKERKKITSWQQGAVIGGVLAAIAAGLFALFPASGSGEDGADGSGDDSAPIGAYELVDTSWTVEPPEAEDTNDLDPFEAEDQARKRRLAEEARERWQNLDIAVTGDR